MNQFWSDLSGMIFKSPRLVKVIFNLYTAKKPQNFNQLQTPLEI